MNWRYWKYIYRSGNFLFFLFLLSFNVLAQNIDSSAIDLLGKVDSTLRITNSIHFKAELFARMKDDDYEQEAVFKFQRKPLKIYYRQFKGNNIELLFDETKDKEKALVNPDGFPYTNLHISPYSSLILKRQHHSVFEADPIYTIDQLLYMIEKCKPNKCNIVLDDTLINNHQYKVINYENIFYKVVKVVADKDIELLDFAKKYKLNFYSIVCLNDGFDNSTEIEKGEVVNIPSSYAQRIELIVNPINNQIVEVQVYDSKGLFEKMKYIWFRKDVNFTDIDFDKDNPDYNF